MLLRNLWRGILAERKRIAVVVYDPVLHPRIKNIILKSDDGFFLHLIPIELLQRPAASCVMDRGNPYQLLRQG